jgi:hypothetical protein
MNGRDVGLAAIAVFVAVAAPNYGYTVLKLV